MKYFKRLLTLSLVFIISCFAFAGCNNNENENNPQNESPSEEIINLSITNYTKYITVIQCNMAGYAAFYVYYQTGLNLRPGYTVKETIIVNFTLSVSYKGYLKTDSTQSKIFHKTVNLTASSYGGMQSIYDLDHKYYGFYEELSGTLIVTSVTGSLVKTGS